MTDRRGGDKLEPEFPAQPLLDDFEMEESEKSAAETKTQGRRGLALVNEARIVEPQLRQTVAEMFEFGGVRGKEAAENHRHRGFESGQGCGRRCARIGDGVADLAIGDAFDSGGDESDFAGRQFRHVDLLRRGDADLVHLVLRAGRHQLDPNTRLQHAVLHPHQNDDAQIRIVPAIDQKRLQRRIAVAHRRRQPRHQRLQHIGHALAGLCRNFDGMATHRCRSRPRFRV